MVKIFFFNFYVLAPHTPHFHAEGVKFIKLLSLGPGLSYIADIGIKQTGIGKFTTNFQGNFWFNSFSLGDNKQFW